MSRILTRQSHRNTAFMLHFSWSHRKTVGRRAINLSVVTRHLMIAHYYARLVHRQKPLWFRVVDRTDSALIVQPLHTADRFPAPLLPVSVGARVRGWLMAPQRLPTSYARPATLHVVWQVPSSERQLVQRWLTRRLPGLTVGSLTRVPGSALVLTVYGPSTLRHTLAYHPRYQQELQALFIRHITSPEEVVVRSGSRPVPHLRRIIRRIAQAEAVVVSSPFVFLGFPTHTSRAQRVQAIQRVQTVFPEFFAFPYSIPR
ncbi:hypothetical protein SAMN00768000_3747 [Sulfobacillus thermosulfidooxidans DSM 9293]|uniref:Uncharacterized protein n=1 Tax=Sulfobacillus thermosulfidooxidans (strain DSM 9293 / VKM B-1269 / AT-1) TaxID=929705 RepID=A0A1W1WPH4_SULTA|nr:hypothetical protein [Sulfobacillus thermosulfidooxidans]SMC08207.1 hypothetical protein SAMN00768000_3747 [Sulfobacillus thermosulfidooxidans DSM 9293]